MRTLCEFFRVTYRPLYLIGRKAEPRTVAGYDLVMRLWNQLTGDQELGDLAIPEKGSLIVARWISAISERNGRNGAFASAATVNLYRRYLLAVLNRARRLGIIHHVPDSDPLRQFIRVPRYVGESQINSIYRACRNARFPTYVKASDWWRALIVLIWNTGVRRWAYLSLLQSDVDWEHNTIWLRPEHAKNGAEQLLPLNEAVCRHLKRLRARHTTKIFFWPHTVRTFYKTWHGIQDAAGISRPHFKLHDIRKTCATEVSKHGSADAAQAMLGHTSFNTTARHYICWPEVLRSVVDRIPQPRAFRA